MASLDQALEALRKADAAGNVEDARRLAQIVRDLQSQPQASQDFGARDYAQSLAGGINTGLTNIAGFPVDLVNLGLQQIGLGSERPFGGSRFLRENLFESTETGRGMIAPGATDQAGRIINRVGEELGASALPAGGIMAAANRARPAANSLAAAFLNPIRNSPGRAAAGELAAATGAGVGAGIAQEAAPGNQAAETLGQIVGGLTPAALVSTPTGLATRAVTATARRVSPAAQRAAGQQAVADLLGQQLTPEAGARLAEAERLREAIPGFQPSIGEATDSPALLAQQRRLENMASGADLEALAARRQATEQAVQRFTETQAPGQPGTPDFVIDSASRNLTDLRADVARQGEDLAGVRGQVADALPTADRAAEGATLRNRLTDLRSEARAELSAQADALGINGVNLRAPFDQFRQELLTEFSPRSVFEDTGNVPSVLRDIADASDMSAVTFSDVKALRERITDDLIDAMSSATPNRKAVRSLTVMRERLDDFVGSLDGEFGDVADSWRAFRQNYFDQVINRFERGVAFKVRQRDGRGFYRTSDEKVADAFFRRGDVEAARQFQRAFGNDPAANTALEATALDSLRDFAVRNGTVDPLRLDIWRRNHASVLNEFPALRRMVDDVEATNAAVIARQDQLAQRSNQIENDILTRELDAFQRATRTSENILGTSLLREPRKMERLVTYLKDTPEAFGALQRVLWQNIAQQDAAGIFRTLTDNAESLSQVFTKQHMENMRDIALARTMLERVPTPQGTAYRVRPFADVEDMIGQGLPQLSSRLFALQTGRASRGFLWVEGALRAMRGRALQSMDDTLRQALYDPEVARDIAAAIRNGGLGQERTRRLQARLFALGPPMVQGEEGQQ